MKVESFFAALKNIPAQRLCDNDNLLRYAMKHLKN